MSDKKKVLIVDDEPAIRRLNARILEPNYETLAFANGHEAIRYIGEYGPDAVLTDFDYEIPGMNGYLFARNIKDAGFRGRIVLVTSQVQHVRQTYADADSFFDGYLDKPFKSQHLLDEIARVLALPRSL